MTADHLERPGQHDPQEPSELIQLAEQLGLLDAQRAEQLRVELALGRPADSGDHLQQRLGLPPVVIDALQLILQQGGSLSSLPAGSTLPPTLRHTPQDAPPGPPPPPPALANTPTLRQVIDQAGLTLQIDQAPSLENRSPDTLGRYPVTGFLGEGGMGQILQVRDEDVGREMAAKVIRGQDSAQALTKFVREAQITGQLEHPNIVPMHELGTTADGQFYFTMKRIDGQDLSALLRDDDEKAQGLTLFDYLQILLKVCDAMSLAHSRGVIHRDLKPANIMVGQFGEVQVMDWGLARLVGQPDTAEAGCTLDLGGGQLAQRARGGGSEEPLKTLDGAVVGTAHYMPPTQAPGDVRKIDQRADVYALGAILYQMLTLEPPFEGDSVWEVLERVIAGHPTPPSKRTLERQIPAELEAVVLKAMQHRPAKRYDSVELMKQDIEAY